MIMLGSDGTITVNIDATSAADITDTCTEFEYSIFEAGDLEADAVGTGCDNVGDQYDPTAQCLPLSGNDYCTQGKLCQDSSYSYDCNFSSARYSCAPGDLSGKVGELISVNTSYGYTKQMDGNTLIPPTDSLIDKVIAINCPNQRSFLACAVIEEYVDDDSVIPISFIISIIISFISSLLY